MSVNDILCLFFLFVLEIRGNDGAIGPENILLLAHREVIAKISLGDLSKGEVLPLDNITNAQFIDYDSSSGFLYWTDVELEVIQRAKLNGSEQTVVVNVGIPTSVAIDWVAKNLYWTDSRTYHIEVSRLDGTSRKALLDYKLDVIHTICLDPEAGYMYWTERHSIQKAFLDGSERKIIITSKGRRRSYFALTLDLVEKQILWYEHGTNRIEVRDMDGGSTRRSLAPENFDHVVGFAVFGDYIYWSNWRNASINRINKHTGKDQATILEGAKFVSDIKCVANTTGGNNGLPKNSCGYHNGGCSHLCLYRPPPLSHVCACPINYELMADDRDRCIHVDSFLAFSVNHGYIKRTSLHRNSVSEPSEMMRADPKDIDFDAWDDRMYWIDSSGSVIFRAFLNGTGVQQIVKALPMRRLQNVAVDWLALNIYWTDSILPSISVSRLNGSSIKVLVERELDGIGGIALDPSRGYMYWVRGKDRIFIERANLDGTNRRVIISNAGKTAGKLIIDYKDRRLYWTDTGKYCIKSSRMDGSPTIWNRLECKGQQIVDLSLYGKYIYWIEGKNNTIERGLKANAEKHVTMIDNVDFSKSIQICSRDRQDRKDGNACVENNGGCQHLCLSNPKINSSNKTHHCMCPSQYTLNYGDGRTCSGPNEYLLLAKDTHLERRVYDVDYAETSVRLKIDTITNVSLLAFDPVGDFIYLVDKKKQRIEVNRIHENGTGASKIIDLDSMPYDMDIDPYSRTLYWTCPKNDVIKVARIDTPNSLIGEILPHYDDIFKPRSIALFPEKGIMFYINLHRYRPRIEKAWMDGSAVVIVQIITENLLCLAIDKRKNRLYWSDLTGIQSSDFNGRRNHKIYWQEPVEKLRRIAIGSEFMYLLNDLYLRRIDSGGYWGLRDRHYYQDIVVVERGATTIWHPCSIDSGGCSHICFSKDNKPQCSCPSGLRLSSDMKTCSVVSKCNEYQFRCDSGQCIPLAWRCDDSPQCDDKSDEMDCDGCGSSVNTLEHADTVSARHHLQTDATNTSDHTSNTTSRTSTKSQNEDKPNISKEVIIAIEFAAVLLLVCVIVFLLWRHKTKNGRNSPNYKEILTVRMQPAAQPGDSSSVEDDSGPYVRIARGKSLTSVASSESEACLGPPLTTSSENLIK